MTLASILDALEPLDDQSFVVDGLAADGVIEDVAEGIFPENADDQGVAIAGERLGRPFDERREVVEVRSLDLILGRDAGCSVASLRAAAAGNQRHRQADEQGPRTQPSGSYHRTKIGRASCRERV